MLAAEFTVEFAGEFAAELPAPAQRNGHHDTPPHTLIRLDPEATA
jgi:hypothetical protein